MTRRDGEMTRRGLFKTLLGRGGIPDPAPAPEPETIEAARALAAGGDLDAAEAAFRRILTADREHPQARLGLARIHASRDRVVQALVECRRILAKHPGHVPARLLLAACHLRQGDADRAAGILVGLDDKAVSPPPEIGPEELSALAALTRPGGPPAGADASGTGPLDSPDSLGPDNGPAASAEPAGREAAKGAGEAAAGPCSASVPAAGPSLSPDLSPRLLGRIEALLDRMPI